MANKIYGYTKCSLRTSKQGRGELITDLIKRGVPVDNIFMDIEYNTTDEKPQFLNLLRAVHTGDTIVSTEVSRMVKSTKQLCELIEVVKDRKLKLIIGTFTIDCTKDIDAMTEGMLKMMMVFYEMERDMLSQRVRIGMAQAKAKGVELGRPKWSTLDIPEQFMAQYELYKNGEITKAEIHRNTGISRPTIDKYIIRLKEEGK